MKIAAIILAILSAPLFAQSTIPPGQFPRNVDPVPSTRTRVVGRCPSAPIYGARLSRDPSEEKSAIGAASCLKYSPGDRVWRSNDYAPLLWWVVTSADSPYYVDDAHPIYILGSGPVDTSDPDAVIEHDVSPYYGTGGFRNWFTPISFIEYGESMKAYNAVRMRTHDGRVFDSMEMRPRTGPNVDAWWPYLPKGIDLSRVEYSPLIILPFEVEVK